MKPVTVRRVNLNASDRVIDVLSRAHGVISPKPMSVDQSRAEQEKSMSERRHIPAADDVEFIAKRLKELEAEKLERVQDQELPAWRASWREKAVPELIASMSTDDQLIGLIEQNNKLLFAWNDLADKIPKVESIDSDAFWQKLIDAGLWGEA